MGEEEEDYPLAWTEIAGVSFEQKILSFKKEKIVDASRKRIAKNSTFNLITQNAKRLKENRDRETYSLNLNGYIAEDKKRKEDAKRFDDVLKPIDAMQILNLTDDMPSFEKDAPKKARNAEWLKDVKKDAHLHETLQIMRDLIENSSIASK
jgi:carboxyl-terminal processing protease